MRARASDFAVALGLLACALAACDSTRGQRRHPDGSGAQRGIPSVSAAYSLDPDVPPEPRPTQGYALVALASGDLALEMHVAPVPSEGSYEEFWGSIFLDSDETPRIDFDVLASEIRPASTQTLDIPAKGATAYFDVYIDDFTPAIGDLVFRSGGVTRSPALHPFAAQSP